MLCFVCEGWHSKTYSRALNAVTVYRIELIMLIDRRCYVHGIKTAFEQRFIKICSKTNMFPQTCYNVTCWVGADAVESENVSNVYMQHKVVIVNETWMLPKYFIPNSKRNLRLNLHHVLQEINLRKWVIFVSSFCQHLQYMPTWINNSVRRTQTINIFQRSDEHFPA